ncbi:MAG: methyltransferase domain-containing protein [Proteobacteria bacterium]|nr:methyltransferase domain-containing protein [Pseudomonadota bacterium]
MKRDLFDYQNQYQEQPYERFQVMFRKRKLLDILSRYKHNAILEVGCGLEPLFLELHDFEKLVVIEPAPHFFKNAVQKQANSALKNKITVLNHDLAGSTDELKKMRFNFIVVSSLLHEISDPGIFLKQVHSIANDETVIHINVPNAKSFHRLLAVEMGLIRDEFEKSQSNIQFQQSTVFDLDLLKRLVTGSGFQVIEEGSFSFKPFTHGQMEDMIQANLLNEKILNGLYKMERYLPLLGSEIFLNVKKVT